MTAPGQGRFSPKAVDVTAVHGNLSQQVIQITVDRLSLILHKKAGYVGRRREWLVPAGIVLTIVLTFATTTFKDWVLPAATWSAAFLLVGALCVVWCVIAVFRALTSGTIEDLVEQIKRQD